jgi:hypothetical protein
MSPKASNLRLALYVAVAMGTAASAGIASVDFADSKQVIQFALSVIVTGMITARSYIDKSESEVPKDN